MNEKKREPTVEFYEGSVEKEMELEDIANIKQIIEIYDNVMRHIFYPDTYIIIKKEDLEKWAHCIEDAMKIRVFETKNFTEIENEMKEYLLPKVPIKNQKSN